ncbi:MAG: hypothetical protein R3F60_01380 [bacterium]
MGLPHGLTQRLQATGRREGRRDPHADLDGIDRVALGPQPIVDVGLDGGLGAHGQGQGVPAHRQGSDDEGLPGDLGPAEDLDAKQTRHRAEAREGEASVDADLRLGHHTTVLADHTSTIGLQRRTGRERPGRLVAAVIVQAATDATRGLGLLIGPRLRRDRRVFRRLLPRAVTAAGPTRLLQHVVAAAQRDAQEPH